MGGRQDLVVGVRRGDADIARRRQVEPAARTLATQEQPGIRLGLARQHERIIAQEGRVGHQVEVPAHRPALGQPVDAGRVDDAAELAVTHLVGAVRIGEDARIVLADAGGADRVVAALEAMPPLDDRHEALARVVARRDEQVVVRLDVPEIGDLDADAGPVGAGDAGHQEAGGLADGRIRRPEARHVGERDAEHLEAAILEIDGALGFPVDDALGLDRPGRRLRLVGPAGIAGRVGRPLENGGVAVLARHFGRADEAAVRRLDVQRADEALRELLVELHVLRMGDDARRLGDAHIAGGAHAARPLVVGDDVGLDGAAVVIDLDAAAGRDPAALLLVDHLPGIDLHGRATLGAGEAEAGARGDRSRCHRRANLRLVLDLRRVEDEQPALGRIGGVLGARGCKSARCGDQHHQAGGRSQGRAGDSGRGSLRAAC